MLANDETLHLIYEVLDKKGYIDIPTFGYSMFPFIRKGDLCRFIPFNKGVLERGDVLLYINESGKLIGHRYHDKTQEGHMFFLKGDSNLSFDPQVHRNQVIGKLVLIQRGDQVIETNDFIARTLGKALVILPFLSRILHYLANQKRKNENVVQVRPLVRKSERSKKTSSH